jgi:diguanylate cyclase (GGDEF)-like protein/PAS domain S-box-containing protein
VGLGGLILAAAVALLFVESSNRQRSALDLAARRSAELARLQVRHDLILTSAGEGIVGIDPGGRATFVNPAAARMLGWSAEELIGTRIGEGIMPSLGPALSAGRVESGEQRVRRRDGSTFPAEHTVTPIVEDGASLGAVVTFRDITARKRLEAQTLESLAAAEERAAIDPLTGLANHRTFHERLRSEVERARRRERSLALVLMDLDHFKRVNDAHGHQVGDRVLQRAAGILASETRVSEMIARVGGEEFAMILPEADADEAMRAAERVRRAIAVADFPTIGRMTMSAGVCLFEHARNAEDLYRLADGALYLAKHHGRDTVVRYTPDVVQALSARDEADRLERQQALVSIRLLARVVDAKDAFTRRHSERVAETCAEVAEALGWSPERCALLREAGLVHDVGKIGVPDAILLKPGPLSDEEYELVKEHSVLGARMVGEALTPEQVTWVRGHHERWDGTGYPDALAAEAIPEGARILALADAWDVMTSERPYRTVPIPPADAIAECRAASGSQFWSGAVEALALIWGEQ